MTDWSDLLRVLHALLLAWAVVFALRDLLIEVRPLGSTSVAGWIMVAMVFLYISEFAISGEAAVYNSWYPMQYSMFREEHVILFLATLAAIVIVQMLGVVFRSRQVETGAETGVVMAGSLFERVAIGFVLLYVLVLLIAYSFNVGELIAAATANRTERFAQLRYLNENEQNPLFALLGVVQPASIAILGAALLERRSFAPGRSLIFVIGMFLLFTQGSRTAFSIALLPAIVAYTRRFSTANRIAVFTSFFVLGFIVNGIILQFRGEGFGSYSSSNAEVVYHQDNNFALSLHAIGFAGSRSERMNATAVIETALLNWVPRTIWPGKPSAEDLDLYYYREAWWTQGIIGEMVSMFGVPWGTTFAIAYIIGMFFLLKWLLSRKMAAGNIAFRFISVLYVYMCLRTCLNLSQYIYVFIPFLIGALRLPEPDVVPTRRS